MHILAMGLPLWGDRQHLERYRSAKGHEVRTVSVDGDADYRFDAGETAAEVVTRIGGAWAVDAFVCFCPELFPPPLEMEHCPVRTVAAVSDWNVYFPQLETNLGRYDLVLTDKPGAQVLPLRGAQAQYVMPLYSHLGLVHRHLGLERDIDIAFAGSLNAAMHPRRTKLLETVASLSSRYRVVITEGLDEAAYTHLLNRAKIAFNCSVRGEMNLRCFEAPACGALLFVEADNLEAPAYLRDGETCVYYTDDNLAALLDTYLRNDLERERIAGNGLRRAGELESIHRLDALFDWIADAAAGRRAFRGLSPVEQQTASILQYASSLCERQRVAARSLIRDALVANPESPELLLIASCDVLNRAQTATGEDQKSLLHDTMGLLKAACDRAPGEAVPMFNFAFACGLIGMTDPEAERLERCLQTTRSSWGGLLLGRSSDPYYCEWRRRLAHGTADVGLVHAAAAARLAELYAVSGSFRDAIVRSELAISLWPACAVAYRHAARAYAGLQEFDRAVEMLELGLPFTALDGEYRAELANAYRRDGRHSDADRLIAETTRLLGAVKSKQDLM